mgnify:CR=1 FL=1
MNKNQMEKIMKITPIFIALIIPLFFAHQLTNVFVITLKAGLNDLAIVSFVFENIFIIIALLFMWDFIRVKKTIIIQNENRIEGIEGDEKNE